MTLIEDLMASIRSLKAVHHCGSVCELGPSWVEIKGLSNLASLGDQITLLSTPNKLIGEVIEVSHDTVKLYLENGVGAVRLGDLARYDGEPAIRPSIHWLGRVLDPNGQPLDGKPVLSGAEQIALRSRPTPPGERAPLGKRLETGMSVFNTFLPVVEGQRIGLFAGSGVGKSSLLASFARNMEADVVVIALVGERGREVREFAEQVNRNAVNSNAVIIAATSDQSALIRRRAAPAAMSVAEYFRDQGKRVLLLVDSITRYAEAHREVALTAGEPPALKGYPPSLSHSIMALCERAGTGPMGGGTITAVFSVLVAGSDMEEPVADILRGVLDGHVVMERAIAERGRFPAIDLLRSVSRSLPDAASEAENALLVEGRRLLGAYDRSEMMIRAGLYNAGSDPELDRAIAIYEDLDAFIARPETKNTAASFAELRRILHSARPSARPRPGKMR